MARRLAPLNLAVLFALCLSLALVGASPAQAQSAGNPAVISVFGKAGSLLVHAWVVVPPGADANAVAANALAAQGARRISSADFTTEGLTWPQFTNASGDVNIKQYYNGASDPTNGGGYSALAAAQGTWSSLTGWTDDPKIVGPHSSNFSFDALGTTGNCPSLVRECPGAQYDDKENDVGWVALSGCCTLGVTWFDTSAHEADMALNTKFPWSTDGVHDYDVQTVFLHEEGHVAGLGHSTYTTAIMYPSYSGVRQVLGPDDIAGIQSLYPDGATSTTGSISGVVTDVSSALAISNASVNTDTGETTATDINGNYSLGSVPTGTRTVTVSAAGYATQSGSVTVNDGQNTIASFSLTPTTGSISGTVTNASSGSPIPAAHVSVDTGQSFDTGADGTYILTNVPAGTRTVTASASGYASDSQAAGVTGGQTTNGIDFALTASAGATTVSVTAVTYSTHGGKNSDKHLDVTVALVDNLGSPVAGASVSMELDNGTGYSSSFAGTTGTDGTVTFTANNIPSGTYTTTGTVTPPNGLNWDGNWPTDSYTKP